MSTPLGAIEEALDRGFRPVDVRSDPRGIEVRLRRGTETHWFRLSREDARKILGIGTPTVHPLFR